MLGVVTRQAALDARYPVWTPRTLDRMLDTAAAEFPDRSFVITDARAWTYAEMADRSRRLAAGLVAMGVHPGDHVALVMANYPEFVACKFAIARAGAVCVPVNILNRRDELAYVLAQSDAVLLITMDRFRDLDYPAMLDEIAPGWERGGGGAALPKLRGVVVFPTGPGPVREGATPFAALDREPVDHAPGDPHSVADIVYTSGTTGPPKGVMLSHDQVLGAAYASVHSRAFEDARRIVFALPMSHVYGYVEGLLPPLFVGGALIPHVRFDAPAMLAAIEHHRATDVLLVPTMTLALIDAARERPYDLSSLIATLSSGGRAPERVWNEIPTTFGPVEITTGYGMTEVTASATMTRPDDPRERLLTTNGRERIAGSAGKLIEYRVVDPATGIEVGAGEVGELRARGPGVTRGYYNKPEATAAAFDAQGWLHTGDLGRIDADRYVTLVGRCKESYRCGGEQVVPAEVEDVLTSHPEVEQAHIVPVPDARMGEIGVAFVVARAGSVVTPAELFALVAGRLARFKHPRHLFLIDAASIPTTASGRARKFLLAERAMALLELS